MLGRCLLRILMNLLWFFDGALLFISCVVFLFVFFFFFQAEDGIRDVAVTGVQTCALPISSWHEVGSLRLASTRERYEELQRQAGWAKTFGLPLELISTGEARDRFPVMRSEERRVGKECRSGWSGE